MTMEDIDSDRHSPVSFLNSSCVQVSQRRKAGVLASAYVLDTHRTYYSLAFVGFRLFHAIILS